MAHLLNEGEYMIPIDCKVKTSKQGDVTILSVTKRRDNVVINDRCRDCKWFGTDYSTFNLRFTTSVCMLKPRHSNNKSYARQTIHYHVRPLQNVCGQFEKR